MASVMCLHLSKEEDKFGHTRFDKRSQVSFVLIFSQLVDHCVT